MGNTQRQGGDKPLGKELTSNSLQSVQCLREAFVLWGERSKTPGGISNTPGRISKDTFENGMFPFAPAYGGMLYDFLCRDPDAGITAGGRLTAVTAGGRLTAVTTGDGLTAERYVEAGLSILQLPTSRADLYFNIFSGNKNYIKKQEVLVMLNLCHDLMRSVAQLGTSHVPRNDAVMTAVIESLFGQCVELAPSDFSVWCGRHCRQLFDGIYQITCAILLGDNSINTQGPRSHSISCISEFGHQVAAGSNLLTSASLWLLTSSLPTSYIPSDGGDEVASSSFQLAMVQACSTSGWHLLYDSDEQGLSVNRFQHHVFEYKGPTLTFVSFKGHVYCVGADSEWREGRQRFGGSDSCLVQILPKYTVMQVGADLLYVNFSDRTVPREVQFGKDARTTFLSIDEGLSKVTHYGIATDLHRIQVWGCAGILTREAQKKQKDWEKKQALKGKDRKIKLDDWENNPDRQLLEMGGVTTEHAQR